MSAVPAGSGRARELASARIVFVLVVVATFAAFGVTQWLKHIPTAVQQLEISPATLTLAGSGKGEVAGGQAGAVGTGGSTGAAAGGGEAGVEQIAFHIHHSDHVTVAVVDSRGDTVRTVARRIWMPAYKRQTFYWKGREADGRPAPAGTYRVSIYLERQKKEVFSPVTFEVVRR